MERLRNIAFAFMSCLPVPGRSDELPGTSSEVTIEVFSDSGLIAKIVLPPDVHPIFTANEINQDPRDENRLVLRGDAEISTPTGQASPVFIRAQHLVATRRTMSLAQAEETAAVRRELEAMRATDQSPIRAALMTGGSTNWEQQARQDRRNMQRLAQIIEQHGWPDQSRFGSNAAEAAFLVLQHSTPEQQKRYLPLVRRASAMREAKQSSLAMLEDRILVADGKPQRYGTQFKLDANGKNALYPIEDRNTVDERRGSVGLGPLDQYVQKINPQ